MLSRSPFTEPRTKQAVIKTANEGTITNANKEGTITKVGELFQGKRDTKLVGTVCLIITGPCTAHQEVRSSDIAGGGEERNRWTRPLHLDANRYHNAGIVNTMVLWRSGDSCSCTEESSTKLGASITSDFPAFTGHLRLHLLQKLHCHTCSLHDPDLRFCANVCSDYPINSAQRGNPGLQGLQTLRSTEDESC